MKRLLAAALLVLGCQPAKDPAPARQPAHQPAAPSPPGQQAGTQSSPTPMPQGADATLSKVDVAIVVGLDQASPALLDKTQDIVARIVATVAMTSDGRVAISAGKKAPKDALLTAAIAGCGVKESSLPDTV